MAKKYQKVYDYYLEMMLDGRLIAGSRMPSLQTCARALGVSKTTAVTAYMQLMDDGYLYAKEKSGYYVTELANRTIRLEGEMARPKASDDRIHADTVTRATDDSLMRNTAWGKIKYDLSTVATDPNAFCYDLWRRYMKSALRSDVRLSTYGEPQGEYDLRVELAKYVRDRRNIICSPDDIVVGPGVQYLLGVLASMLVVREISLPTRSFHEADRIFKDYGYDVRYRDKTCKNIYVAPAYMTAWGDVMTNKRRSELLEHSRKDDHFIIEDDYLNDFVYSNRPTPSLYALSGGRSVAYLGSFSRILMPSIRISFMILPAELKKEYMHKAQGLSQLASKTEQMALCQFLRDGHLAAHVRKLRRIYSRKRDNAIRVATSSFDGLGNVRMGDSGTEMEITFACADKAKLKRNLENEGIKVRFLQESEKEATILLSCSGSAEDEFAVGVQKLARIIGYESNDV